MRLSKLQLTEILETFSESIKKDKPVVFCVRCGSTHLDQNSIDELRCYKCGNSLAWNSYRFSISREEDFADVTAALETVIRDEFSDWHIEMEQTLGELTKIVVVDCFPTSQTPAERIANIEKEWIERKEKIDELIAKRKSEILS